MSNRKREREHLKGKSLKKQRKGHPPNRPIMTGKQFGRRGRVINLGRKGRVFFVRWRKEKQRMNSEQEGISSGGERLQALQGLVLKNSCRNQIRKISTESRKGVPFT